jgi:hypothetical protein
LTFPDELDPGLVPNQTKLLIGLLRRKKDEALVFLGVSRFATVFVRFPITPFFTDILLSIEFIDNCKDLYEDCRKA